MNTNTLPISPELLEILRDPYAIQQNTEQGGDPGRLELVHNSWLVSPETGYKYPIRDGIPVMLIEEGRRWQETAVSDLPVPPPAPPAAVPSSAGHQTGLSRPRPTPSSQSSPPSSPPFSSSPFGGA